MVVVNVEFKVEPTSIQDPAFKVKGHLVCDQAAKIELNFGGRVVSSSKFLKSYEGVKILDDKLTVLAEKGKEREFELILTATSEISERLMVSRGKDFIWGIIGNFYPFVAQRVELPITVKSSRSRINLAVNLVLRDNMIPYGGKTVGFESQSSYNDGKFRMFSGSASGENEVSKSFCFTLRFTPFFAFREALSPALLVYAAALITLVLNKIVALSLQWEILNVSIESSVALRLLQMVANAYIFLKISKIRINIVGTRCLLTALKVGAWAFLGLLILNAVYPGVLAVLGFNVFDFALKATQVWIVTTIIISIFIYPYIENEKKRTHAMSFLILIAFVSSIWLTVSFPPLQTASDLLRAS